MSAPKKRPTTTPGKPLADDLPRLITADELAAILGMSKRTVWRLVASGEVPEPLRVGGSTRWPLDEIEAWLDAGCPPCTDGD